MAEKLIIGDPKDLHITVTVENDVAAIRFVDQGSVLELALQKGKLPCIIFQRPNGAAPAVITIDDSGELIMQEPDTPGAYSEFVRTIKTRTGPEIT